jgi:hypothetical protein
MSIAPERADERSRQRPFVWLYAAIAGVFPLSLASGSHEHGVPPVAAALAALAVLAVVPVSRALAAPLGRTIDAALRVVLATLSAGAAAIHFVVSPHHFDEYWVFGVFFAVCALAQIAWAVLVVVAPSATILALGALGNIGVVALWIYTRTIGLPLGPDAGETEAIGTPDVLSSAFELVLAAGAAAALAYPIARPLGPRAFRLGTGAALLAILALTTLGLLRGATAH